MKLCFNQATTLENSNLVKDLKHCEKHGYDYIEIRTMDKLPEYLEEHTIEELAEFLMQIILSHLPSTPSYSLITAIKTAISR